MSLTAYHAKLFAHELTKRSSSDNVDKLASALSDAQVDLNPHQIEAALFAFRSPLSKGAILADEVGLGKTIEAGILLAQRWAERSRNLLVICPANLRKQWSQELLDKFFLPTAILEAKTFNEAIRGGNLNPFDQPKIILCSYQFARSKEPYLRQTAWDLVVIDEAHRLRNVYKSSNKIAVAIKSALAGRQKVLLTATPLQNSLLELYGLVSIVDEFIFGDLRSFRAQFTRAAAAKTTAKEDAEEYSSLRERIRPVCQRTLRRQVYPGDGKQFQAVQLSPPLTVVVPAAVTVTIGAKPVGAALNAPVAFPVTVSGAGAGTCTGAIASTVTLSGVAVVSAPSALTNGAGSFAFTPTAAGNYAVTVSYAPDAACFCAPGSQTTSVAFP
jgi:hypothetical protein